MVRRASVVLIAASLLVALAGYGLSLRSGSSPAKAAQPSATWNSAMVWEPTLAGSGEALAGVINQIDASCSVDVDSVMTTNGADPQGSVYAFAISWTCPGDPAEMSGAGWNSALLWRPTLAESGDALAEILNEIDASCSVDVDSVVAASGAGPEGPVYAFAITWAC